ncbi:hypothetical protein [Streptomyces sp. 6N223]|uniref:hypothetical protein n=1 Tax=Streptomyces sp. 6N223 TaxID=3457412 RepID=UPI003FD6658A
MARNDETQALSMLHGTLLDTRKELQAALKTGFEQVQTSSSEGMTSIQENVTAELSRMRENLRDTRNRLTQTGGELSFEVRGMLTRVTEELGLLRAELRGHPDAPSAAAPGEPSEHEGHERNAEEGVSADVPGEDPDGWVRGAVATGPVEAALPAAHAAAPTSLPSQAVAEESVFATRVADAVLTALTSKLDPLAAGVEGVREDIGRLNGSVTAPAGSELEPAGRPATDTAGLAEQLGDLREEIAALADVLTTPAQPQSQQPDDALAEQIAAAREEIAALSQRLETTTRPAEGEAQLAVVRADFAELTERLDTATAESSPDPEQEKVPVTEQHRQLLTRAARIASARLVCHQDTLDWLASQAGAHPHFRLPAQITDQDEGRIAANVSGRSLIAVLITLHTTRHTAADGDGDWALATTCYDRVADSLASLTETGGHRPTIVLDDGTAALTEPDRARTDSPDVVATEVGDSAEVCGGQHEVDAAEETEDKDTGEQPNQE